MVPWYLCRILQVKTKLNTHQEVIFWSTRLNEQGKLLIKIEQLTSIQSNPMVKITPCPTLIPPDESWLDYVIMCEIS